MRISKSLFISFITIFLFACSNNSESKLSYTDVETVKNYIQSMEVEVSWTKELEPDKLEEKTEPEDRLGEGLQYNKNTILVLPDYKQSVYPSLEDFGSLNTSVMSDIQNKTITGVCSALATNVYNGPESFFQNKYQFNLFFFRKELIENWKVNFEEDFPVKPEDFDLKKSEKPEEVEGEDSAEEPQLPDPIFNNWIIGEPFNGEGIAEIPVRFFSKKGSVDVTIYMNPNSENSIFQITINRWGK